MRGYSEGTRVERDWGDGTGTGTVRMVHTQKISRKIKGAEGTRDAGEDAPACLVEQEDGDEVPKSHDELRKASRTAAIRPTRRVGFPPASLHARSPVRSGA